MPINLYSPNPADPNSISSPMRSAAQQTHRRRQDTAEKFFGTNAATRHIQRRGETDLRKIGQVVDMYGMDQVIEMMSQTAEIYKSGKRGVEDLRLQMEQARANNDIAEYQRLLGTELVQRQQEFDVKMMKDARFWNVMTAAVGGLSNIMGIKFDQMLWDKFLADLDLRGVGQLASKFGSPTPFEGGF